MGVFLTRDVIVKNSYGKFYCRKKDEDLHIVGEHFEYETLSIFKNLAKNAKVIIDVGAHIGKYTILASKLCKGRVISIEASKENFFILRNNIKLNKCKNVLALNAAATKSNRRLKLYKRGTSGSYTLKLKTSNYESVDGIALSSLLKKLGIKKVDLIKIDVEGAELDVIEGLKQYLSSHRVDNMILEIWKENYNKVKKKLASLGYSIEEIEYDNWNYLIRPNNIIHNKSKK